jgi:hypothetical protein
VVIPSSVYQQLLGRPPRSFSSSTLLCHSLHWYHRAQHTYTLILAAEMLFKLDDSSNFGMLVPSDAEGLRAYTCP